MTADFMEVFNKLKNALARDWAFIALVACRCGRFLLIALFAAGCSERQASKKILIEFKQQPEEKYVYRITDHVEWDIQDTTGHYAYQHEQEQKSEMTIAAIDSAAVRSLTMRFAVTKDTLINAPEFSWHKKRGSLVGHSFVYQLRMRKNGEIIEVKSEHPKVTFYFNSSYKPSQPVFPDHAILPGFSWTQNFQIDVPEGNPTVATTQYQLNGFAKVDRFDCAVIDFKGELEFEECFKRPDEKQSGQFVIKKYHSQMTSAGQIYFAYREGFMVKKANLISSTVRTTAFTKDKVETQSQTICQDHEAITLMEIHRPRGEVTRYRIQ